MTEKNNKKIKVSKTQTFVCSSSSAILLSSAWFSCIHQHSRWWHLSQSRYLFTVSSNTAYAFSALTLLVGWQEGYPACKNWVVGCWRGYLSAARCSWCHCYSLSLAPVKSRLVLPFWYWLTWVVTDKGLLSGCGGVSVLTLHDKCQCIRYSTTMLIMIKQVARVILRWQYKACDSLLNNGVAPDKKAAINSK